MTHDIRLAVASDYPAICAYLDAHWRKGHIFTTHKALFDWQHLQRDGKTYNFVLGCAPDGAIDGVLGFIPHGQFDPALGFDSIWLCIWSVCEAARGYGLGRRLLDFIEETFKPTFLATNGASEMSLPLYQARGWETGKLEHWYMVPRNLGRTQVTDPGNSIPGKSDAYVESRYSRHPWYQYMVAGRTAMRLCRGASDTDVLRIVECGSLESLANMRWQSVSDDTRKVFIDFYCAGFDSDGLEAIGFTRRIADEVIIPNHFEPYEHRNIDINYAVKAPKGMPWRIVKADGDQDRPNVLP